jgi:hypothetical protein
LRPHSHSRHPSSAPTTSPRKKGKQAEKAAARTKQDAHAQADAHGFYSLFDGKSLDGWKANENPQTFKVQDGNIVVNGNRAHLFYVGPVHNHDFKDFHFKAEVMTFPNSNSGIYFHTNEKDQAWPEHGFECQVNNTFKTDPRKTGGLYAVKDVMNTPPSATMSGSPTTSSSRATTSS